MKPLPELFQQRIRLAPLQLLQISTARFAFLLVVFFSVAGNVFGQTITWTGSFIQGQAPTSQQCQDWTSFLEELGGKSFASVTISGSFDQTGKSINDPVAANALAALLHSRTPGTVQAGDHYWTVTMCQAGACGGMSIALSVDGSKTSCECTDSYTLRPQSTNEDWGGVNVGSSCNAPSQTMNLVFNSGVTIAVDGSTTLCEGATATLTARAQSCTQPNYLWNTGATTQSITVSGPGTYSVKVEGAGGCGGTERVIIQTSDIAVSAGEDMVYCQTESPVQLHAVGISQSGAGRRINEVCIYNSPGGAGIDDCSFTTDVCLEGATFIGSTSYSKSISFKNPEELRYNIYYSAFAEVSTFRFKLNNYELGTFQETNPTGVCDTKAEQKFPRTVSFDQSQFKPYWIEGGNNEVRVEIETPINGIYLAGITAEIVTSNETFSWSPVAGLSNASIRDPIATPLSTTIYTVTYQDGNGCIVTDEVEVKVRCGTSPPPVAMCKELLKELSDACEAVVEANEFNGGSTGSSDLTFSVSPAGPYPVGITNVVFTVTDSEGGSNSCTTNVTVKDVGLPVFEDLADLIFANDAGSCSAEIVLDIPVASDNCAVKTITNDQDDHVFPVGETIVTWTVTDIHGNSQTTQQKITVTNSDPVIVSVHASSSVEVGTPATITTRYADNNIRSASIDWGDGSAAQSVSVPDEVFEVTHSYSHEGSYPVVVSLSDKCNAVATYVYESIRVADNGGSVRGDGWFNSLPGYYLKDKRASGKAQFHFQAKSKKGSEQPVGSVSFKFKDGKIEFKSSALQWLHVENDRATLTASGKLNGKRGYSILISAVDDDHRRKNDHGGKKHKTKDRVRVKILDGSGKVVYDTQRGEPDGAIATTDIGGGSIDIDNHDKNQFLDQLHENIASHFGEESSSVYPNPFTDWLNVQFNSASSEAVVVRLMDLTGKVVASAVHSVSDDGYYPLDIPENTRKGIYILTITQGMRIDYLRLVRK